MEDQGKRTLLAVFLAFAILMVWQYLFVPTEPPPDPSSEGNSVTEQSQNGSQAPGTGIGTGTSGVPPTADSQRALGTSLSASPRSEQKPEQEFSLSFDNFDAVFTNVGGKLKSWRLLGEKFTESVGETTRQIDLVRTKDPRLLPFEIGFQGMNLIPADAVWDVVEQNENSIAFAWKYVSEEDGRVLLEFGKRFTVDPDNYLLDVSFDVANRAAGDLELSTLISLYGYQDPNESTGGGFTQVDSSWKASCFANDELLLFGNEDLQERPWQEAGIVRWAGMSQNYFLVAASPVLAGQRDAGLTCRMEADNRVIGAMRTEIAFPTTLSKSGDPAINYSVVTYLGPKYLERLEEIDKLPAFAERLGYPPALGRSVDMGWFEFVARPLLSLLQIFYGFVGNWGIAIILLTFTVKLATLYWTTKSMRSMKAMAKLKPQVEALQKKYKDDRQKQQVEMMNLYKAHKVNPMSGCLPMLLQAPIWFALYRMLMVAGELYHAPFVPGWIDDLTSEDPYYIMPVILMVMLFIQSRLTPTTADSTQQKIMMYGLPLSFGVFSFFLPSGLTIYILTNTVLTSLHHLWLHRTTPQDTPKTGDNTAEEVANTSKDVAAAASVSGSADESPDRDDGQGSRKKSDGQSKGSRRKRQARKGDGNQKKRRGNASR